ncbi:MAG: hypothetical protein U9P14_06070 [Gemmatimonadota bacterium]|nr:hypothetical protein [Gemmatimonadota bacterium]
MDDKMKLIIIGVAGSLVSFALFFFIFKLVMPAPAPEAAAAAAAAAGQEQAGASTPVSLQGVPSRVDRMPGAEIIVPDYEIGEIIPDNPIVLGYDSTMWGMDPDTVRQIVRQLGYPAPLEYTPDKTEFISLVYLNPDIRRVKVEYRFFRGRLFHVEVYYSSAEHKNMGYSAFLLNIMRRYGKPYEEYSSVNELGDIIMHVKWDTEHSLIELVSRPHGHYSLFIRSQGIGYELEEVRKDAEQMNP